MNIGLRRRWIIAIRAPTNAVAPRILVIEGYLAPAGDESPASQGGEGEEAEARRSKEGSPALNGAMPFYLATA